MQKIFPWQQSAWQQLIKSKNLNRLPHAILMAGIKGIGKNIFAKSFAELLLCQENFNKTTACGSCASCGLLDSENHPDLFILEPEGTGKTIKIDQVRSLIEELNNTSLQGGNKVAIVESAERLNSAAANALLKTLEEPVPNTFLILVSASSMMLPATIRSRCQSMIINTPSYSESSEWLRSQQPSIDPKLILALAENAPLRALELANGNILSERKEFFNGFYKMQRGELSAVQMVAENLSWGFDNFLTILLYIVSDLIKLKLSATDGFINSDQLDKFNIIAAKVSMDHLLKYQDKLYKLQEYLSKKINLNQQLAMENLMITWLQILRLSTTK